MINKQELKYLFSAVVFALVWFGFLLPQLIKFIEIQSPYFQFFVVNLGIFILLQIFLKSKSLGLKIELTGALGVICLFVALDIFMPPLMVGFDGALLNGPQLAASSSDYFFGYLAIQLGLTGFLIFLFTYVLIPTILLLIASKLLPNFVRKL